MARSTHDSVVLGLSGEGVVLLQLILRAFSRLPLASASVQYRDDVERVAQQIGMSSDEVTPTRLSAHQWSAEPLAAPEYFLEFARSDYVVVQAAVRTDMADLFGDELRDATGAARARFVELADAFSFDPDARYVCPVCGYPELEEQPRSRGGGGSYEICPSCGFEFGYTDDDQGWSDDAWRAKWVAEGMQWASAGITPPPTHWDPSAQLAALLGT